MTGRYIYATVLIISFRLNVCFSSTSFPLSINDISSISFIRERRYDEALSILSRYSVTLLPSIAFFLTREESPIIEFSGVLISCDIMDRKSLFASFRAFASTIALSIFSVRCLDLHLMATMHIAVITVAVIKQTSTRISP